MMMVVVTSLRRFWVALYLRCLDLPRSGGSRTGLKIESEGRRVRRSLADVNINWNRQWMQLIIIIPLFISYFYRHLLCCPWLLPQITGIDPVLEVWYAKINIVPKLMIWLGNNLLQEMEYYELWMLVQSCLICLNEGRNASPIHDSNSGSSKLPSHSVYVFKEKYKYELPW